MTTATPNTRVSDLNKVIACVEKWKKARPDLTPAGKDPETDFMQLVTMSWLADIEKDQWPGMYLWAAAGMASQAVLEMADDIGVEDLTVFDNFMGNMPLMVATIAGDNLEGDCSADEEALHKYGDTLISDFFIKENN